MRSLALALCAACAASSPRPASVRLIESKELAPDWTRTTKDGSVISRDLLTAVELGYPDISYDGKYYSMVRPGAGELYVGRIGAQPRPLLLTILDYQWIGEHSLIYRGDDGWYRADAADEAFTKIEKKKIAAIEGKESYSSFRKHSRIMNVSPDGNRVIIAMVGKDEKLSPWRYDVRTGAFTELIHNTRYDEVFVDENDRPAFAVERNERGGDLKVHERLERGWVERTIDLPKETISIVEVRRGEVMLAVGSEQEPRYVLWNATTNAVKDWLPRGASRAVFDDAGEKPLVARYGRTWRAVDPAYANIVAQLDALAIEHVNAQTERFWTAIAKVGDDEAYYTIDVTRGEVRELGLHRDRKHAAAPLRSEIVEIPGAGRVTVYQAVAPERGIVFYNADLYYERYDRKLMRLLTSRGYHVVTGASEVYGHRLDGVAEEHAAWARKQLGSLPMACLYVNICNIAAAADIDDEHRPWSPAWDGSVQKTAELRFSAGWPHSRTLADYDEEREYERSSEDTLARDQAPVSGVALRGRSQVIHDVARFQLIEAFLAQHLGGRMEPLAWDQLRDAGVRIAYGFDKLRFLAGHDELRLVPLTKAERAELKRGFATLLDQFRATVTAPCSTVEARLGKLRPPASLARYRTSNEFIVLSYELRTDADEVVKRSACTTSGADRVIESMLRAIEIDES